MIEVLEPLAALPGVELSMLVTPDGMPIAVAHRRDAVEEEGSSALKGEALAALAIGWSNELRLATAPLSWSEPTRAVLRCARGSIVMRRMRGAVLLLVLGRGVSPEDVRLSMDGTVARIERSLRGSDDRSSSTHATSNPPGPIPNPRAVEPDGLVQERTNTARSEGLPGN